MQYLTQSLKTYFQHGFKDIYRPIPMRLEFKLDEKEAIMPNPGEPLPNMNMFPILETVFAEGEEPKRETSVAVSSSAPSPSL